MLFAPRKVIMQVIAIMDALLMRIPHPPEFILVQVSTSFVSGLCVWSKLIIRKQESSQHPYPCTRMACRLAAW